jgi:hypothetical protein
MTAGSADQAEGTIHLTAQNVVESRGKAFVTGRASVARTLLVALSTQCKSYCILSGYDRLPDHFDTDFDFMVDPEDFERMPRIVDEVARQTGNRLFQAIDHEITGRAYFLGSLDGPSLTIVQPDCAADYRHFGRRWLPAREVLSARRLHPEGFYVPSTAHEFAYLLIKRLNLRSFNREHGYRLHRLYVEDRIECGRMIARFCRGPEGSSIVRMASANDWAPMYASLDSYRSAMLRSQRETLAQKLQSIPQLAAHLVKRMMRPAGCWIAFTGADHHAIALALNAVSREFAPSFRTISYHRMRARGAGRETTALHSPSHVDAPQGAAASIATVAGLWIENLLKWVARILPGVIGAELVLFDRCLHDLPVDSKRIGYAGPPSVLRAAARFSPRPGLVILLDTPPEALRSAGSGIQVSEMARQRSAYLDLMRDFPSQAVINATQEPAAVIHDAVKAVLAHLEKRTRKRLDIEA